MAVKAGEDSDINFAHEIANNPNVQGVKWGKEAMSASGLQPEFAAANMAATSHYGCSLILRAGAPPQYNKKRSPKSGVNLTKTSNQGLFRGALSKEERFARLQDDRKPRPHHTKDKAHLNVSPTDPEYQHTMQLDINMQDIIRETGPEGDLTVLGFDESTGLLRLGYKEDKGPLSDNFSGQFVIDLLSGDAEPQWFSRPWDSPEHDPNYDSEKNIITKPDSLSVIPDTVYENCFHHQFKVGYTEERTASPSSSDIKKAEVFANRPRSAEEFKNAMGKEHKYYKEIEDCDSLAEILEILSHKNDAEVVILDTYDKGGSIVAGDWDGMALGHPEGISDAYSKVYNTFDPVNGLDEMIGLMTASRNYLDEQKAIILEKKPLERTQFENFILSIDDFGDMVSDFALARAGCITPHEFVFQQCINLAYRDEANTHLGEAFDMNALQTVISSLIATVDDRDTPLDKSLIQEMIVEQLNQNAKDTGKQIPNHAIINLMVNHVHDHLIKAQKGDSLTTYQLPHIQHDVNIHDLYQHGFDMRNPYGSNLEGAWVLVNPDGSILYGDTQEQLIEVLLTGEFLRNNIISINHGAEMSKGWDRVIERQLELDQPITDKTLYAYAQYLEDKLSKGEQVTLSNQFKTRFADAMSRYEQPDSEAKPDVKSQAKALNNLLHQTKLIDKATIYGERFDALKEKCLDLKNRLKISFNQKSNDNRGTEDIKNIKGPGR